MTDKPNTAMADAFFGIFGLRRIEMKKRNAENDVSYVNTELGDDLSLEGAREIIHKLEKIARHWIPRAVKAEKKAKERKETIALNGIYDRARPRC